MIKVSVLYPNEEDSRFDMAYYCTNHIPMVRRLLGSAIKNVAVEQGISGQASGSRPAYLAIGHLCFDSVEAFQAAFGPHADMIMNDIANYTNSKPTIQISEVKL
jgi:uncharacterized protein (TIGR02118 family)